MRQLQQEDWLPIARSLAVGQSTRVRHGRESRPNLVIHHESGHYWAYCQACKEGGKLIKDHVLVTGVKAPATSTSLSIPRDRVLVSKAEPLVQDAIARFLAKKNMDAMYLPDLWYSEDRKRLLMQTEQGWLGRDLTGDSNQKWLTYNSSTLWLAPTKLPLQSHVVLVEDAFSYFKLSVALNSELPSVVPVCLLGTSVRDGLLIRILSSQCTTHFMLDGDEAGARGAQREAKRLRALGLSTYIGNAPDGLDPKDMTIQQIRESVRAGCTRLGILG